MKKNTRKTPQKKSVPPIAKGVKVNPALKKQANATGPGIFSNFESAKFSNKRSWIWSSWPQDFKKTMTVFDRMETTRKMRWLELNAGLIRQVIADMATYSVGSGIKMQAQSGSEPWDEQAEKYFNKWASRSCDITGRYSFFELQHICCRLMDRDGECFIIKTKGADGRPKLQVIESHRVGNPGNDGAPPPGMVDGIFFGPYGAPQYYNVIRSDGSSRRVPANAVMHLYEPELASGARAYSPLQHSINNLVDMLEILSLEKEAVKTNSDLVRTITRENAQFDGTQSDFEAFGMRPQDYGENGLADPREASTFIGGKTLALAPGEKLESFESNRPNSTFNGFIEHLMRDSLAGVLPFEFVHDATKAGGATMRFIVAKADRKFQHRQNVLMQRFLTPVWGYIIGNAIKNGEIPSIDSWMQVSSTTPRRVTVDAGRDAQQTRLDIETGIKTITQFHLENGDDPREQMRANAAEKAYIKELAEEFEIQPSAIYKPQNVAPDAIDASFSEEGAQGKDTMTIQDDGEDVKVDVDDPNVKRKVKNPPDEE
jgi:lambda family phage portal protein